MILKSLLPLSACYYCWTGTREGGAEFHLTESQPRKEKNPLAFVQEKGLWVWGVGGSSEPVVCHVLGGLCGGVRVEHSLGTNCSLNWSHLIAPPWKS